MCFLDSALGHSETTAHPGKPRTQGHGPANGAGRAGSDCVDLGRQLSVAVMSAAHTTSHTVGAKPKTGGPHRTKRMMHRCPRAVQPTPAIPTALLNPRGRCSTGCEMRRADPPQQVSSRRWESLKEGTPFSLIYTTLCGWLVMGGTLVTAGVSPKLCGKPYPDAHALGICRRICRSGVQPSPLHFPKSISGKW